MKAVRKILAGVMLASLLFVSQMGADIGSAFVVMNGVTTNTTSAEFNVSKASFIRVRAYSSAGSVADVIVQARSGTSTSEPWYVIDSTANVDATTGWYESIPVAMRLRFVVQNYVSGTIYIILETHQISP